MSDSSCQTKNSEIQAEMMVECPRPPRCHVPWKECYICAYNVRVHQHIWFVECAYNSSHTTNIGEDDE